MIVVANSRVINTLGALGRVLLLKDLSRNLSLLIVILKEAVLEHDLVERVFLNVVVSATCSDGIGRTSFLYLSTFLLAVSTLEALTSHETTRVNVRFSKCR